MNPQNVNKLRVKEIISLSPGIHLRLLQRFLGASFSTTRYHVRKLEEENQIIRSTFGGFERFFLAGTTAHMQDVYACLQNKRSRLVLQGIIGSQQGLSQNSLLQVTKIHPTTIRAPINSLLEAGLIERFLTPDGRIMYGAVNKDEAAVLLASFKTSMNSITNNFIDLWEF